MDCDTLFRLGIAQSWQLIIVTCFVCLITRFSPIGRSPFVAHLLWAIVLVKAITPPIWSSPLSLFNWLEPAVLNAQSSQHAFSDELTQRLEATASENTRPSAIATNIVSDSSDWILGDTATVVVSFWAFGAFFTSLLVFLRMWCASYWMQASKPGKQSSHFQRYIETQVHKTARKLQLKHDVPVQVVGGNIGPALVGVLRPTLVLPFAVIANRSGRFMEIVLAHELMHKRRGDLLWAMLQVIATSICWFHPAVWFAAKRLRIEAEKSCDVQTIAALGCSPRDYANVLLEVLKRKEEILVLPTYPGIRPVDITRNRMERIMRLKKDCRQRTPLWGWALFAVGLVSVIPGAAITAERKQDGKAVHAGSGDNHDVSLLAIKPPEQYTFGPGDVLGVTISRILPSADGKGRTGFPITVLENGCISLPLVDPLPVADLDIDQVRNAIRDAYVHSKILKPGSELKVIVTVILKRTTSVVVWRFDRPDRKAPELIKLDGFKNDILNALMETGGLPQRGRFSSVQTLEAEHSSDTRLDTLSELVESGKTIKLNNSKDVILPANNVSGFRITEECNPVLESGDHLIVLPTTRTK